jgi:hypothetical protein
MKNASRSCLYTLATAAGVLLCAMPAQAALPQVFSPNRIVYVRPGGTSFTWTYGTGTTPQPGFPGNYSVTQISYHNVPAINYFLTRGRFEFSTDSGSSWSTYPAGINNNTSFTTVAGKIWRFVDTLGSDSTTSNNLGFAYFLGGGTSGNVGTTGFVLPDTAPTDLTPDRSTVFDSLPNGTTLAYVTPVDVGSATDGWWVLENQSVANLFGISFDRTTGNKVALTKSTGTMPAIGTVVTATLRYYDLYQTDVSGNPISGQGFSKTLSFTVTSEVSNALTLGNDIRVNTFTTDNQSSASVARLSTGNLAVVWQSASQGSKSPATNSGIYGQLLSSAGAAVGSEFVISNAGATVDETSPVVTALNAGRFAVAYLTKTGTASASVGYRIIEANGTVGSQLLANATATDDKNSPSITTLTDGSFVIAWASANGDIRARNFTAAAGAPVAADVLFADGAVAGGYFTSVAALSSGSYAVAWADGAAGEIKFRVNGGSTVSTGIISAYFAGPRLAGLTGGGFVLASESYNSGTNLSQIEAARYTNSGTIQGAKFQVNTVSTGNRYAASIAALTGGGFVIGWSAESGDFELNGLFGRRYTSAGAAVDTSEFQVNQHRAGDQSYPAMTAMPNDAFATVWTDINAASIAAGTYPGDIEARILVVTPPDTTPPTVLSIVRRLPSTAQATTSTSATFRVTFSEAVNAPTTANFAVAAVGSSITGSIGTVSAVNSSTYDVPVTITGGSGEFRLKVID